MQIESPRWKGPVARTYRYRLNKGGQHRRVGRRDRWDPDGRHIRRIGWVGAVQSPASTGKAAVGPASNEFKAEARLCSGTLRSKPPVPIDVGAVQLADQRCRRAGQCSCGAICGVGRRYQRISRRCQCQRIGRRT